VRPGHHQRDVKKKQTNQADPPYELVTSWLTIGTHKEEISWLGWFKGCVVQAM
jgi:hypothetical protein